jgi:DNA-binding LacI/PurR family transcriptional regulator
MGDVARRAGVSRTAVSYALTGRPGVSDSTRALVRQIAAEIGFEANHAARAMHGGTVQTVGMVLRRPVGSLSLEAFRRQFIGGVEAALQDQGYGLLIQFVTDLQSEVDTLRRWWSQRYVDGYLLMSLRAGDPRLRATEEMGALAVLIGGPDPSTSLPTLWTDDAAAIVEAMRYLAALGHRRIVRVAGPPDMLHTAMRTQAFDAVCRQLGIADTATTLPGGYTREDGQRATRMLLGMTPRPTAILYDNDVAAMAGLAVAREMGVRVPTELSIVGWEDSMLAEVVRPTLTVLRRDIVAYGQLAAEMLLATIHGESPGTVQGDTPQLEVRGSTGPAPA